MIIFKNRESILELSLEEIDESNLPSCGDGKMSAKVDSVGFCGRQNEFWIGSNDLRSFWSSLIELEKHRRGEAVLESMSPNEFSIRLYAVDSLGHMAVEGKIGRYNQCDYKGFDQSVLFGFLFDPSQLSQALDERWI